MRECYKSIIDMKQIHIIVIDNAEDPDVGLRLIQTDCAGQIRSIQVESIPMKIYQCMLENITFLYICAKENLGYAKGNNLGAFIAKNYYGDSYYLFSNNDLSFPKSFSIEQLLKPMKKNESIGAVGPRIIDGNGNVQSPRKKIGAWKQLFLTYYDLLLPKTIKFTDKITDVDNHNCSQPCYWVTGSFIMVDATKFHEIQGFDEHTFLYCEEIILAERLQKKEYYMYYENDVSILHQHGQTVQSTFSAIQGIHISFQSMLYFYRTYRKLNRMIVILAQINYLLFALLFMLKKQVGQWLSK